MRRLITAVALSALLVACGGGGGGGTSAPPPVVPAPSTGPTTVTGKITFDDVPVALSGSTSRLNYPGTVRLPARTVVVEALDANTLALVASTSTNAAGDYSLGLPAGRTVFMRAKARMVVNGGASFAVVDNTNAGAQWAIDGTPFATSQGAVLTQNLNAPSGWNGSGYVSSQRAAGPFAILDTVYQGTQKILSVDPGANFPALNLNWSPNNITSSGSLSLGQIGTSFYGGLSGGSRNLYILGFANNDTDEYDDHVVAHEFGHYLQDVFSRDDTVGGAHGGNNDRLDMRVAFSEGWGNGWAGIALNNPIYADTSGASQAAGGSFNVSVGETTNPGWFKEPSVEKVFWDLNASALGFGPIWTVMKTGLTVSPALSGIHSFARALANNNGAATLTIQNILATQSIALPLSPYADNETNFGSPPIANLSPIYLSYGLPGTSLPNVCVGNATDPNRDFNKAGEYRYVRLTLPTSGSRSFTVTQSSSTTGNSDPDLVLYDNSGAILTADSAVNRTETTTPTVLAAGSYVLVITDFALSKSTLNGGNTNACFTVVVN